MILKVPKKSTGMIQSVFELILFTSCPFGRYGNRYLSGLPAMLTHASMLVTLPDEDGLFKLLCSLDSHFFAFVSSWLDLLPTTQLPLPSLLRMPG